MFFAVIAHDKPERLDIRIKTGPAHRAYGQRTDLPARFLVGAPLTKDDGATMIGLLILLEAPDRGAVETYLTGDPYVVADIFERVDVIALHESFGDAAKRLFPEAE